MGTRCTITAIAKDRMSSISQIERLVRSLEDTEKNLSTWQDGSALTALNRWPVGDSFAVEPNLCGLFQDLMHWTRETDGAFDPAIGVLIDIWGIRTGGRFPSDGELKKARHRSGMQYYRMDHANCRIIKTSDVLIDCGAFGKGEALDRLRCLDAQDDKSPWFVNLGGQVAVQGIPSGTTGWRVDIAHPKRRDEPVLTIRMASGSLSPAAVPSATFIWRKRQ